MVKELWYSGDDVWARKYLQKIVDLYFFDSKQFKTPEDINPNNLGNFIEIILKHYQYYHLDIAHLWNLGDALDVYIYRGTAFKDELLDEYLTYSDNDRRNLALKLSSDCFDAASLWQIMPEDVSFVIECLNAPNSEIINMYDKLDKYFAQFDIMQKGNIERPKRSATINAERLEAIKDGQPLPIRPMGIELDPCYKKNINNN